MSRWISLHSFRHAKVFSLLDQGWKIEKVAAYMGHKSVQTTFQYVHLGPEEMRSDSTFKISAPGGESQYPPDWYYPSRINSIT